MKLRAVIFVSTPTLICVRTPDQGDLSETVLSRVLTIFSKSRSVIYLRHFALVKNEGGGTDKNTKSPPSPWKNENF